MDRVKCRSTCFKAGEATVKKRGERQAVPVEEARAVENKHLRKDRVRQGKDGTTEERNDEPAKISVCKHHKLLATGRMLAATRTFRRSTGNTPLVLITASVG
mgnify:CR=1 FL=1